MTEQADTPEVPRRSNIWVRLHKRLTRRGVVDVDIDHHRYEMLCCIRAGIQDLMMDHPELGPKDDLASEDYKHILESSIRTESGKTFTFTSYASPVFATIRRAVDVDEEDYLNTIAPEDLPYLEFISNSKSGQDFYLSNNRQYILKTDRRYCINFFLSMLGNYLQHFQTYPHSLIVKYLGLYSIKMPAEQKKFFLVMQSIYYPSERIEYRFDIKGCFAGRYQKPNPPDSDVITVLKDRNFDEEEKKITLGSQKEWFVQQLKADVNLMKELGVQDYSLLIGYHELHPQERKISFSDVVLRVQKSLRPPSESPKKHIFKLEESSSASSSPLKVGRLSPSRTGQSPSHNADESKPKQTHIKLSDITAADVTETLEQFEKTGESLQRETTEASHLVSDTQTSHRSVNNVCNDDSVTVNGSSVLCGDALYRIPSDAPIVDNTHECFEMKTFKKPPLKKQKSILRSLTDISYLDDNGIKNRRLLPNCKNALHIIDGDKHRYYLGLIDFFTLYEFRQKAARICKNIKYACRDHSTIPPSEYADRLFQFVADNTE